MQTQQYNFSYQVFSADEELNNTHKNLLQKARTIASTAYAPYSNFFVGAAALLQNGKIITGTNQENASYPVGICAERSLLATAATLYPNIPIVAMAISYINNKNTATVPVAPCGMCRQSLLEYEKRQQQSFTLILSGQEGEVFVIEKASMLLPLNFSKDNLLNQY